MLIQLLLKSNWHNTACFDVEEELLGNYMLRHNNFELIYKISKVYSDRKRQQESSADATRRHSKMAVSRHLGYYRTGNSDIRYADPENPSLEPNMEWIGCPVCEIFAFKLYCDLETGFRGHSRSSKAALSDRAHRTSIVTIICLFLVPFPRYSCILVENCYPPCI